MRCMGAGCGEQIDKNRCCSLEGDMTLEHYDLVTCHSLCSFHTRVQELPQVIKVLLRDSLSRYNEQVVQSLLKSVLIIGNQVQSNNWYAMHLSFH